MKFITSLIWLSIPFILNGIQDGYLTPSNVGHVCGFIVDIYILTSVSLVARAFKLENATPPMLNDVLVINVCSVRMMAVARKLHTVHGLDQGEQICITDIMKILLINDIFI